MTDTRGAPSFVEDDPWYEGNFIKIYTDYNNESDPTPSYWNQEWAEADQNIEENRHYGITYESWMRPQKLYEFLTEEKLFTEFTVSATNLVEELQNKNFDIGDLVFYGSPGDFQHVAIITNRWAPQTFFGGFIPLPIAEENNLITSWTMYMIFNQDSCENYEIFTNMAYMRDDASQQVLQSTTVNFDSFPVMPRVVERSGGILYSGSRSINNTIKPYNSYTIVHIE